jgi:hypothetical protein
VVLQCTRDGRGWPLGGRPAPRTLDKHQHGRGASRGPAPASPAPMRESVEAGRLAGCWRRGTTSPSAVQWVRCPGRAGQVGLAAGLGWSQAGLGRKRGGVRVCSVRGAGHTFFRAPTQTTPHSTHPGAGDWVMSPAGTLQWSSGFPSAGRCVVGFFLPSPARPQAASTTRGAGPPRGKRCGSEAGTSWGLGGRPHQFLPPPQTQSGWTDSP